MVPISSFFQANAHRALAMVANPTVAMVHINDFIRRPSNVNKKKYKLFIEKGLTSQFRKCGIRIVITGQFGKFSDQLQLSRMRQMPESLDHCIGAIEHCGPVGFGAVVGIGQGDCGSN